jgi:integrase/recombinase XerD
MTNKGTSQQPAAEVEEWDRPIGRHKPAPAERPSPAPGRTPSVEEAIDAWIASRSFAPSTIKAAHHHLESARARGWRAKQGVVTIDQLTAEKAAAYILYLRDRGASPATLRKVKMLLSGLLAFCAEMPGYGPRDDGAHLSVLRLPPLVERIPEALTEQECLRLLAVCASLRDRLIVETLLLAGLRVSELCALTIDNCHLDERPAYVHVSGSIHNPLSPKTPRERRVVIDYDSNGFGRGYVGRLRRYIESERPETYHREVFLSCRRDKRGGVFAPLTRDGVQQVMDRLGRASGIHCNPHKLRHTFATRCVDKGVPMFHLQDALGHSSLDMVRRYYTHSQRAQAEGFYRAFATSSGYRTNGRA